MAFVSVCVILGVLVLCDLVRGLIGRLGRPTLKTALMDAVLSVETCAVGFEMGVIMELHGVYCWLAGIFCNCLYQSFRWHGLQPPIPYMHVTDYLDSKQTLTAVAWRSAVMVAAGLATYRYFTTPLWGLGLTRPHIGRAVATSTAACRVPWHSIPVSHSFMAEVLGTAALTIGPNLVVDNPILQNNEPRLTNILVSAMIVAAVYLGMDLSGGFYSPMLATVVFGGCAGHTMAQHLAIYWVGSTLGAVFGHMVYPTVKSVVYKSPSAIKSSTKKKAN